MTGCADGVTPYDVAITPRVCNTWDFVRIAQEIARSAPVAVIAKELANDGGGKRPKWRGLSHDESENMGCRTIQRTSPPSLAVELMVVIRRRSPSG